MTRDGGAEVYMSFAGDDGWLGGLVVAVDVSHKKQQAALVAAVRKAWQLGLNPGGEVAAIIVRPGTIHPDEFNRLLTREEAENLRSV